MPVQPGDYDFHSLGNCYLDLIKDGQIVRIILNENMKYKLSQENIDSEGYTVLKIAFK